MRFAIPACVLAFAACHAARAPGDPDPSGDDTVDTVDVDAGVSSYQVSVQGGFGAGTYRPGDVVHVWADLDPKSELLTEWTGDASLLVGQNEWHTTFVMPAHDVALAAQTHAVAVTFTQSKFTGPTGLARGMYSKIPAQPKGLLLALHGTGGSAKLLLTPEMEYVALAALDRGYGVISLDAAEVVAGDQNGDGKIRWSTSPTATNPDLRDLDALIAQLRSSQVIAAQTPVYALGMSNGGATSIFLGAISATSLASTFPRLRFAAVISHCADGSAQAAAVTTTPTAWRQCGHDDNAEVSNSEALANSTTIAGRGIATEYVENPPSPLYDARFTRAGTDLAASAGIASELRAAGFTDSGGMFTAGSATIQAAITANPTMYPTLLAQTPTVQGAVLDQLRVMEAEHQMFADLASRDIDWLDAHP